jgi:Holliday junction resolvasome RuvABC endonuclease subunit
MTSFLLGLDPSPLRLGWALARLEDGTPVACGRVSLSEPPGVRAALAAVEAVARWSRGEVALVYVEAPWHGHSRAGVIRAAETSGQVIQAASRRGPHAPIEWLQPAEWRRLAGLPGNASKDAVMVKAKELGWDPRANQDAADAALIATGGAQRNTEDGWPSRWDGDGAPCTAGQLGQTLAPAVRSIADATSPPARQPGAKTVRRVHGRNGGQIRLLATS